MRYNICIISDIHGDLIDIPNHDLLIIAGDTVPLYIQTNFQKCIDWLNSDFKQWIDKQKDVVLVWGNHDFVGDTYGTERKNTLRDTINNLGVHLLVDEEYIWNGIKIYGTPYGDYPVGWAFDENSSSLKKRYEHIPDDTDILITHCPPELENYDVVDTRLGPRHCGSRDLAHVVRMKKPKYHFFGHIHEGDHVMRNIGGTYYNNVSIKDENYIIYYKPFVLEYEKTDKYTDR